MAVEKEPGRSSPRIQKSQKNHNKFTWEIHKVSLLEFLAELYGDTDGNSGTLPSNRMHDYLLDFNKHNYTCAHVC